VPITPWDWSFDLSEEDAAVELADCPEGGVLVVHSPPRGHVDASSAGDHLGSTAILETIERRQPRLAVCGHIHESWGQSSRIGATDVRNLGPEGTWLEV
jgi:Icc-related predicted phosphoesterase